MRIICEIAYTTELIPVFIKSIFSLFQNFRDFNKLSRVGCLFGSSSQHSTFLPKKKKKLKLNILND
jgi:hypothetical protein